MLPEIVYGTRKSRTQNMLWGIENGTCTLLRTSIDLFRRDASSCINGKIRDEIRAEWEAIDKDQEANAIFWDFLRKERNNIVHEYEWSAYEMWLDSEGNLNPPKLSLLSLRPEDARSVLIMRGGKYKGRDSLELLIESADWVNE